MPEAKQALELALREAIRPGHRTIGPEHVLLGLLRLDVASASLRSRGHRPAPAPCRGDAPPRRSRTTRSVTPACEAEAARARFRAWRSRPGC
ncbi:MAG: Clp protease N-terminal domain-containing protein [Actinomycetota bacterium]